MVPQESFISGYAYNKEKSLLKVNITGKIYAYENTKQIEILYSDTNIYQKEIINNEKNFNLGDLNEKGFILAYSGKEISIDEYKDETHMEDYNPFIMFKSTEMDNDWEIQME